MLFLICCFGSNNWPVDWFWFLIYNNLLQASTDEINFAFRRLSKIYHPDKHLDPAKKKSAEDVFNKLKKAHESWCFTSFGAFFRFCFLSHWVINYHYWVLHFCFSILISSYQFRMCLDSFNQSDSASWVRYKKIVHYNLYAVYVLFLTEITYNCEQSFFLFLF